MAETKSTTYLFKDISHTWETLEFGSGIPDILYKQRSYANDPDWFYGQVIDKHLVYRVFDACNGEIREKTRYVFCGDSIIKESQGHMWELVESESLCMIRYKDILYGEDVRNHIEFLDSFDREVDIRNKAVIQRILQCIKNPLQRLSFGPFLEVYIRTENRDGGLNGVPKRIVDELYGRKHNAYSSVRIDKDLVVITGKRNYKYLPLKEQSRTYFDKDGAYYFIQNVVTGLWEKADICKLIAMEQETRERLIDRDIFRNTFAERFAERAMVKKGVSTDKIIYASLIAQIGFLCAEQAAKTDKYLFERILEWIYEGSIKNGEKSLPAVFNLTGPQLKYLNGIDIPDDIERFSAYIKDQEFIKYFPDIKKRIFAAWFSLYCTGLFLLWYKNPPLEDIFLGAKTLCSIEKIEYEKRKRIIDEYRDYLAMRKQYLRLISCISKDDVLYKEVQAFGEVPINLKPSRIQDAHNKLGSLIDILSQKNMIEESDPVIRKRKEREAKDIEYTNGQYSIIMPNDASEIIREGRKLHHCVGRGGYIESMASNTCRILFLRDNSRISDPLITIEEVGGRIRQCYGFEDNYNHDSKIRDFIKEYAYEKNFRIETVIYSEN